jgi:hypothetical protein
MLLSSFLAGSDGFIGVRQLGIESTKVQRLDVYVFDFQPLLNIIVDVLNNIIRRPISNSGVILWKKFVNIVSSKTA